VNDVKRLWNLLTLAGRKRPPVGSTPADEVYRENKLRLLHYRPVADGGARHATPILMVPSLINRHYVLDLMPGKSLAEFLIAQGHDVYVIDWGTPGDEDRYVTFDDVCDRWLGRAVRRVARDGGSGKTHLFGYCLGGTLTAIHAAARPDHIASLAVMAAPIRFGGDDGQLAAWVRTPAFDVDALVDAFGNVPWQLMQGAFHLLRPTLNLSKAAHLVERAWDDEFLDGFLALETWGNDNVSFPGECYRRYIRELYREDALVKGTFTLSGDRVSLANVTCPTLAVTFENDHIVPAPSATPLLDHVGTDDKDRIHLPGGHVGAATSRAAARTLWPRLSAWWAARDGISSAHEARGANQRAAARRDHRVR
jgi:polyhydroxyalkanoate synthase